MRRVLLAGLSVVLGAGCSVIFNPSKVPCAPDTCVPFEHADAGCVSNQCVYTCEALFEDKDKDLGNTGSNGCEYGCGAFAVELHALVGSPSGSVNWLWNPPVGGNARRYQLCTGDSSTALNTCVFVDGAQACARPLGGFACSAAIPGTNNIRQYARLQTEDPCGNLGPDGGAPTRSASPINGQFVSQADLTLEGNCGGMIGLDAGVLQFTQNGLCLTAQLFGDPLWKDFTLRSEMYLGSSTVDFGGGIAFHYPTGTQISRNSFVMVQNTAGTPVTSGFTARLNADAIDRYSATSMARLDSNKWYGVEVVSVGGEISASFAPIDEVPQPIIRWREPTVAGAPQEGRFGIYQLTPFNIGAQPQVVQFRNLTVATRAELPDAGTGSLKLDFATSSIPLGVRTVSNAAANVKMVTCPTFPSGSGCSSGCQPDPASHCLEIVELVAAHGKAVFDQPLGLDPRKPWRVSLKFAPLAVGNGGQILGTLSGPHAVLRGPMGGWAGKLVALGVDSNATLTPNTWNRIDFNFTDSTYTLSVNGVPATGALQFPPDPKWDAHLGAFILGGQDQDTGNIHAFWTDVEIAQPP